MQDDKKEFSVLVDRSLGGSSIVDGQIELMLHRYVIVSLKCLIPSLCIQSQNYPSDDALSYSCGSVLSSLFE